MEVSLFVGWLAGTLAAGTLGSAGGSGVSVGVYGRDLAIISYNDMIACIWSSPIENGDDGDGLLTASARSSIERRAAMVEEEPGTGQIRGKNFIVFATRLERVSGTYTV